MSRHTVVKGKYQYVYGWDNMLQSFYLQKHNLEEEDEEKRIVVWLGGADSPMPEVENLVLAARKNGLQISHSRRVMLYGAKDSGG